MILVAFSATSALAQNPAQPANPAPQDDAPETADANAPSESHIAAAIDLLKANHTIATTQTMLDILIPAAIQQAKTRQIKSDADAEMIRTIRDARRTSAIERHFSEQDLNCAISPLFIAANLARNM